MYNNKSARNIGLPKEFYKTFWNGLEEPSLNSIRTSLIKQLVKFLNKNGLD